MSVSVTQIGLAQEQITTKYLREGILPSASLITKEVAAYFAKKRAGLPRFTYREAYANQRSNMEHYNYMMAEAYEDIHVSYEDIKRLGNEVLSITSYYESNRIKINRKLQNLEVLNERLEQRKLTSQVTDVVGDNLTDFTRIEFIGDESRNIPKTTAFVNLLTNDIEIPRKRGKTHKYDISKATVKFASNKGKVVHFSSINTVLTDTMYDAWRCVVESDDDSGVKGCLTIELEEPIHVSNVIINMQSGRKLLTLLEVSVDGGNTYKRYEERSINSTYQWIIPNQMVTHIRFHISHHEPTNANGELFDYLFGIKRIELLEVLYEDKAVFVSKPYSLPRLNQIESVLLNTEDSSVHPSTSVRYFYGLDDGMTPVEWNEIKNKEVHFTGDVETLNVHVDRYTDHYGKKVYEYYGQKFYTIFQFPEKSTLTNTKVLMGRNMWLKEIIKAPFEDNPPEVDDESDKVTYQTGPQDWVRAVSSFKGFLHVNSRRDFLSKNHFHRYTIYIESEENDEFVGTFYKSNSNESPSQASWTVYVNGEKNKGRTNKDPENEMNINYNISLSKGWNKIEVYAYAKEENEQINLDFYKPNMRYNIYGVQEPLTEVTLYDLINNSTTRTPTRFSVDERELFDGSVVNSIVLNYNPKQLDLMPVISNNHDGTTTEKIIPGDGIEYEISYKYAPTGLLNDIKVRFMAILTKETPQIQTSPTIKGYTLQFK